MSSDVSICLTSIKLQNCISEKQNETVPLGSETVWWRRKTRQAIFYSPLEEVPAWKQPCTGLAALSSCLCIPCSLHYPGTTVSQWWWWWGVCSKPWCRLSRGIGVCWSLQRVLPSCQSFLFHEDCGIIEPGEEYLLWRSEGWEKVWHITSIQNFTSSISSGLLSAVLRPKLIAMKQTAQISFKTFSQSFLQYVQSGVDIMTSQNPKSIASLGDTLKNDNTCAGKRPPVSSLLPSLLRFHPSRESISHILVAAESFSASGSTLETSMKSQKGGI